MGTSSSAKLHRLPATPAAPGAARRLLTVGEGFDQDVLWAAQLLISELVTNALVHPRPPCAVIVVSVLISAKTLRVEVRDSDPTPPRRASSSSVADENGRGLRLLEALASRWGCHPGPGNGKTVWFELAA